MSNLDKEIRRADEAARLMNEPMVQEAFNLIESDIHSAMRRSAIGDRDTHHELVLSLQMLGRIRNHFQSVLETGKLAQIQKESLAQKAAKLFRAA